MFILYCNLLLTSYPWFHLLSASYWFPAKRPLPSARWRFALTKQRESSIRDRACISRRAGSLPLMLWTRLHIIERSKSWSRTRAKIFWPSIFGASYLSRQIFLPIFSLEELSACCCSYYEDVYYWFNQFERAEAQHYFDGEARDYYRVKKMSFTITSGCFGLFSSVQNCCVLRYVCVMLIHHTSEETSSHWTHQKDREKEPVVKRERERTPFVIMSSS